MSDKEDDIEVETLEALLKLIDDRDCLVLISEEEGKIDVTIDVRVTDAEIRSLRDRMLVDNVWKYIRSVGIVAEGNDAKFRQLLQSMKNEQPEYTALTDVLANKIWVAYESGIKAIEYDYDDPLFDADIQAWDEKERAKTQSLEVALHALKARVLDDSRFDELRGYGRNIPETLFNKLRNSEDLDTIRSVLEKIFDYVEPNQQIISIDDFMEAIENSPWRLRFSVQKSQVDSDENIKALVDSLEQRNLLSY